MATAAVKSVAPDRLQAPVQTRRATVVSALLIFAALMYSRWVLAPVYLITFDAINFALSIDDFDPALHQPQPPGYPLFVALLKLLSFIRDIHTLFFTAAVLVSAVALALIWKLTDEIAGQGWGVIAALLLLFNPPFWFSALTNPVRLTLAMGAAGIALCVWNGLRRASPAWIVAAACVAGLAAGFRPMVGLRLAPLIIWAAFKIRIDWRSAALSLLAFGLAVCSWLSVLVAECGGLNRFLEILADYSKQQIAPTSLLFGAGLRSVASMWWDGIVWSSLGALSWIWLVPFARKIRPGTDLLAWRFLGMWFIPGLIFHLTVHVADPDHTVGTAVATCIAGALVLKRASRTARSRFVLVSVAVALNVFLFFKPISKTAKASTYKPVQWMDRYISDVMDGMAQLRVSGPVTAIFHEPITGWRQLSYYYPDLHIIVFAPKNGGIEVRHIRGRRSGTQLIKSNVIAVPSCGTLAWVDPVARPVGRVPIESIRSRIFFTRELTQSEFDFRQYRLIPGSEPCDSAAP